MSAESGVRSITDSTPSQFRRISIEQKEVMLDFMMKHPALGTGRFTGLDGAKHKQRLLKELAEALNSMPNGVTKSAEKWLKSWQDWRSDVKSKASLLKKEMNKTGGGTMCNVKSLTPLEEKLLGFLGPCAVSGHEEVPDPLIIGPQDSGDDIENQSAREEEGTVGVIQYVNTDSNQELMIFRIDGSSNISASADASPSSRVTTPVIGTPLALADENVSSAFSSIQASDDSQLGPSASGKKRKRSAGCTPTQNDDPLVTLAREQVSCLKEQNELIRERNSIALQQLQVAERKAATFERAANAFIGSMKALEDYLRKTGGNS